MEPRLSRQLGRGEGRLAWTAEACVPSLSLYALAKTQSKLNVALRAIVEPLAALFSLRRARSPK